MTYALQVETSVPRPGRRFEPIQERQLHQTALWACEGLRGAARGLVVVPEFAGPIGVPDFTAFVGSLGRLRTRNSAGIKPILNELDAGIVAGAHTRKALESRQIANTLGWPVSTVTGRVRRLVGSGALIEVSPGRYVRPSELSPAGRLYAIEAKIEDWRSALQQVRTYRVWADAYVLVMSALSDRAAELLKTEVLRDQGGLIVDGRWIARPRLGTVKERRRLQAAEYFASATGAGLSDPSLASSVHS